LQRRGKLEQKNWNGDAEEKIGSQKKLKSVDRDQNSPGEDLGKWVVKKLTGCRAGKRLKRKRSEEKLKKGKDHGF